jgi:hypothetical protein
MALKKRLTDTGKWDKNWFLELSLEKKILWLYVLDKCDHAGICEFNSKMYSAALGFKVSKEFVEETLEKQVHWINNYRFIILDFIEFQYGKLNPNSRVHLSVLECLKKYNLNIEELKNQCCQTLLGFSDTLSENSDRVKDQDKDQNKDKDQDKDQDLGKGGVGEKDKFTKPTLEELRAYIKEKNYTFTAEAFLAHYESNGWKVGKNPMKCWKSACTTWKVNQKNFSKSNGKLPSEDPEGTAEAINDMFSGAKK